jgi:hypothetical protein
MKRALLVAVALLFIGSLSIAQEKKEKHPWASFKEGSFIKTKETSGNLQMQITGSTVVTVVTVKKVDDESVTLKYEVSENDIQKRPYEQRILLNKPKAVPEVSMEESESLKVDGKTFKCTVEKTTLKGNDSTTVTTTWKCADAPGGFVKQTEKMTHGPGVLGYPYSQTTDLVKIEDTLRIGDKQLKCYVHESVTMTGGFPFRQVTKTWFSEDIPGFVAKSEHTCYELGPEGKETSKKVFEALEYDVK